jgi:hypothetical protein
MNNMLGRISSTIYSPEESKTMCKNKNTVSCEMGLMKRNW